MPSRKQFRRRAGREVPAHDETSTDPASDSFPWNNRNRRRNLPNPNHEPHQRQPSPIRRRDNVHHAPETATAGIKQYHKTLRPNVLALYKSIKASTVRLQRDLETLTDNIDKLAPDEDCMEWRHSPTTIIRAPVLCPCAFVAGHGGANGGAIRADDVAPALTHSYPHQHLEHGGMLNAVLPNMAVAPSAPQQNPTNTQGQEQNLTTHALDCQLPLLPKTRFHLHPQPESNHHPNQGHFTTQTQAQTQIQPQHQPMAPSNPATEIPTTKPNPNPKDSRHVHFIE